MTKHEWGQSGPWRPVKRLQHFPEGSLHRIVRFSKKKKKNTGCPVNFEFQINNKYIFKYNYRHAICGTFLY